jgi:hypothetical protein
MEKRRDIFQSSESWSVGHGLDEKSRLTVWLWRLFKGR